MNILDEEDIIILGLWESVEALSNCTLNKNGMIKCQKNIEPNVFVVSVEKYIWVALAALCVQNVQKKAGYKTLSGKEPVLTVDANLKVVNEQDGIQNVEKLRKKKIQNIAKVLPYDHWEVWITVRCAVNNIL